MPVTRSVAPGRFDAAERRQAKRSGRERGCWTYISAEQLHAAGVDPDGPCPTYRVWAGQRARFIVTLYTAPPTEGSTTE